MADIELFSPDDRRSLDLLFRRTEGHEAADRLAFLWDWERRNPAGLGGRPSILVVREGPTVIAACPVMRVRAVVHGQVVTGAWSDGPLVVGERQRQGLGGALLRAWDRSSGLTLGARLTEATRQRLDEMRWPAAVSVPCLVKPISRRALRLPHWPVALNRLVSAVTLPFVRLVSRLQPIVDEIESVRRFPAEVDTLWAEVRDSFDVAVCREATYLNWKFLEAPHVRYHVALLRRDGQLRGYVVYRHGREPQGRVTTIIDLLAHPGDVRTIAALASWVDREARSEDVDKVRCYVTHKGFRRALRRLGFFAVRSDLALTVKVNAVSVAPAFYTDTERWHFTLGDGTIDH